MGISIETLVAAKKFTSETVLGGGAVVGKNVTISSITPIDGGNRITFSYTLDNGTTKTSTLDVMNGVNGTDGKDGIGVKGDPGTNGSDGADGIGITSVAKTKTEGLVDTYTITFTDGSTFNYDVTNGKNGKDGSGSSTGEENVIESIKVNGVVQTVAEDKSVDITVPTVDVDKNYVDTELDKKANTSDIPSLDGYVTDEELTTKGYLTSHQDISGKVDKVKGKSLIDDTEIERLKSVKNYDDTEIKTELIKKANSTDIPTKVSDLQNDSNYQTDTDITTTLTPYATKTYVGEQISNADHLKREIVTEIPKPETADKNTIYMLKIESVTGNDKYREYLLIDGTVQCVGDTSVDLTDYAKTTDVDKKLNNKADKTEIPTVPTVISAFTNDKGYMTEFTETDPTVPAWAKAENKPSYTAAEVHALPDDTEIPIFINKTVLDGITAEKVTDWDETVTDKHSHTNKAVIDKFTESDNGTVLYNGEQIASGNLWNGTKAEYDVITPKDADTTYIVTDEEDTVASALIDDTKIDTQSTWSSKKINSYSNDEQIIGTYLDDKIIYRRSLEISLDGELQKTLDFIHQGVTALGGGEDISIYVNQIMPTADLSSWNIDTMVKVYGHVIDYTDTTKTEKGVDLPYPVTYSAKAYVTGWYNYRTKLYTIRVGEQYANRSTAFLTFEYTKN